MLDIEDEDPEEDQGEDSDMHVSYELEDDLIEKFWLTTCLLVQMEICVYFILGLDNFCRTFEFLLFGLDFELDFV